MKLIHVYCRIVLLYCLFEKRTTLSLSLSPSRQQALYNRKFFLRRVAEGTLLSTAVITDQAEAAITNTRIYAPKPKSLEGKVIIITGATTGLGLESAKRLAAAGATTVLTARTEEKGVNAVNKVKTHLSERSITNIDNLFSITLNLDDLESVKTFSQRYVEKLGRNTKISVLMNNAGVAGIPQRELTKDGYERTFQSNHLGPFLLTAKLFPYLDRANGARVINVSSKLHSFAAAVGGKLGLSETLENLNGEVEYNADGWQAYSLSKLENILFTQELQRRSEGLDWFSTFSLHPGVVGTDIWRNTYVAKKEQQNLSSSSIQSIASNLFYGSTISIEEGANTQIYLSCINNNEAKRVKGLYFGEDRQPRKLETFANDSNIAKLLWERSEALTGVEFKVE